ARRREQVDQQRQGQVAVPDGAAERPGGGALSVHVDPLVVQRGVGEGVDALLRHPYGVAGSELTPEQVVQESELGFGHLGQYRPSAGAFPGRPGTSLATRRRGRAVRTRANTPSAATRPLTYFTNTSV